MSACAKTQLALPYSLSKTAKTGWRLCSQTSLSWEAAFSIGEDQLLIRSWSRGKAQLPSASGIQAIVLYPCPIITPSWYSWVLSFKVLASGLPHAVWSIATNICSVAGTCCSNCSRYSIISFFRSGLQSCKAS